MKKKFIEKIILMGITILTITNAYYIPVSAKWIKDSKNNWNWLENGIKVNGWKEINQKWYYFNKDGTMTIGWLNYEGAWYNLSNSGAMDIGWKEIDGKWYHFSSSGKMSIGWINDNGTWYFTNSSGEMETGTLGIEGKVYNFSENGTLLSTKEAAQDLKTDLSSTDKLSTSDDSNARTAYVSTKEGSLNIREEATLSSNIIGSLSKGVEIKVLGSESNGFYPIVTNGKEGWVSSKWVSFKKPESTSLSISTDDISISNTTPPPVSNKEEGKDKNLELEEKSTDMNLEDDSLGEGVIRDTAPDLDNEYYYSDGNLFYKVKLSPPFYSGGKPIKGNCTWYAWGRAWELTRVKPDDAGFRGNAYEWWAANKKSGKYQYGSEPRVGAIAVWKSDLPGSEGSGHVAIVEKISNGKVFISESTWHGGAFRYREIYEINHMYGYIYLDKPNL